MATQGVVYLSNWNSQTFKNFGLGTLCLASGICLVAGLLTPVASTLTVLCSMGLALSWLPLPAHYFFSEHFAIVNTIAMAIAIAVLGPGAFSLDSRMFGRREIVIPPSVRAAPIQK